MNLDFAQEYFTQNHQHEMSFEDFLHILNKGLNLVKEHHNQVFQSSNLSNSDLNSLHVALSYNQHVILKELIS